MWATREKVSLLLSNGHGSAWNYPLGMVRDEVEMIVKRDNRVMGTMGTLIQSALTTTVPFSDKQGATKAWKNFRKLIALFMGE